MAAQNLLEDPRDVKEMAASINRSAGEMLSLIQDLLDVERMALGKLTLHVAEHDVSEIIKQAVEQLQGAAASKGVTLEAEPQDVCGYVVCDRSRAMQVLSNLIGNAIKFTPAKGKFQSAIPARESPRRKLKPSSSVSHRYITTTVAV
jgi:signal transduction histidine kinase